MRIAAACLAGALALSACSGGSDGDSDDSGGTSSPSASASADTGGGTGGSGSASASGALEGSWLATTGGKAVALVVTGTEAGLFATGGTVCSGTAGEESGTERIRLKCSDGSKDRAAGTVDSVGDSTLKVTWEGGLGAETYTKAEGGKLPTGLPDPNSGP
ncbi:hypothetical protein AQJ91_30995 [Streptomyces dysideae]|uniref:Serine/threonine protein kinase n=2 Tax=Streptomyces dysideae TaxID=909626 RepID=A0A101UV18_9ACTN|nr:hypothetical protein [Streptomyces dysideae]KUO17382.1 hypothetical protein AQJ91_30995 [Streptomyces dysideae]